MGEPLNQEDEREAKGNLGAVKGEAVCLVSRIHIFSSSPKARKAESKKEETIFGSKDSHFLLKLGQWRKTLAVLYITPVVHMLLRLLTWSYHPCLSEY